MGYYLSWGNHSSPSEALLEVLIKNCQKNSLHFVETIKEKEMINKLKGTNFADLYLWGVENLAGPWTMIYNKQNEVLYAFFENEADQMGFKLTWV